jgi:hypothetical protein
MPGARPCQVERGELAGSLFAVIQLNSVALLTQDKFVGSGGVSWVSSAIEFIDISLR